MMTNQFGSSRMDTVLKMLLIAFVSLLAFSSGVYFGKQLSDSDYQLKALESDFNTSGMKTAQKKSGASDKPTNPEDVINEEEVAALSDKLVSQSKDILVKEEMAQADAKKPEEARGVASESTAHDDHHAAPAAKAPVAKAHASAPAKAEKPATVKVAPPAVKEAAAPTAPAKPDISAAQKAAARVAHNAAPTEPAKPKTNEQRVPTSLPKTVGAAQDVEFTVQVASYPTSEAAKERAEELVKKGFPAFPVEANVNGKVWYRVSVGSFKTQKEATTYRAQLMKQASVPSAIVQRIQR